ncbi:MAG: hypothetical protein FJ098_07905, partial [Deltaproteobacteria bacterium]|nr:hypothetical protein [Deltaproteobacteria bacterium]
MKIHGALLVAALLLALGPGCGGDKPMPPPPGQEKKADEPSAAKEKPAAETPVEAPEKPSEAEHQATPGEPGGGTEDEPGSAEAGAEVPDKPVAAPPQIERALAKTALHGGLAPLDTLVTRLGTILSPQLKALMETAVYGELLGNIAGEMGMADMAWFDRSRSLRIAVQSKDSVVLLVPLVSPETLLAALPAEKRAELEGKTPLRFAMGNGFAEVVGRDLLVSDRQENIDALDGTLKVELSRLEVTKLFSVIMEGASLHPLVSTALDEAERGMEKFAPMEPRQKEFIAKLFNLLKDILAEIDRLEVGLDLAEGDLVLSYVMSAREGTNLHAAVSGARSAVVDTLKYIPSKSWMSGGQDINPALFLPWLERYMDILASAYGMSTDDRIELWKDYKAMIDLMTGDAAFGLYTDAGFPLSATMVSGVSDGARIQELVYGVYNYFFQKVMETLPQETRQMFAGRTFKELVAQVQGMVASFGVDLKVDAETYQGVTMDYFRITLDYTKMNLPADAAWLQDLLKEKIEFVMAFAPDRMIFTMGPNGLVRAKEIVDGTPQGDIATMFPGVEAG